MNSPRNVDLPPWYGKSKFVLLFMRCKSSEMPLNKKYYAKGFVHINNKPLI